MKKLLLSVLATSLIAGCSSKPIQENIKRSDVGEVLNVEFSKVTAKPSIAIVLLGGAVGGVVGSQLGGGSGKNWATAAGAIAGAALTDDQLTKHYNQVAYSVYFPNTNENIKIISPNVTSNIKKNDVVVVYQNNNKIKIDAYGAYTTDKYIELQKSLAAGKLN